MKVEDEEIEEKQCVKMEREDGERDGEGISDKICKTPKCEKDGVKSEYVKQEGEELSTLVTACPLKQPRVLIRRIEITDISVAESPRHHLLARKEERGVRSQQRPRELSPLRGKFSLRQTGQVTTWKRKMIGQLAKPKKLLPVSSKNGIGLGASHNPSVISPRNQNTAAVLAELDRMEEEESEFESLDESDGSISHDSEDEDAFENGEDIILDGCNAEPDEEWTPSGKKSRHTPSGWPTPSSSPTPSGWPSPTGSTTRGSTGSKATRSEVTSTDPPQPQLIENPQRSAPESLSSVEKDKWHDASEKDCAPHLPRFQPKRLPGPQLIRTATYSPLQLFQLFFSTSVVTTLVKNTNKYAEQRKKAGLKFKWDPLTVTEFFGFLALIIHMDLVKLKTYSDYWSQKEGYRQSFPHSVMSRLRFLTISWNLHLSDPEEDAQNTAKKGTDQYDKLFKIKPLYTDILSACRACFHPRRELSVDERMVASKARVGLKQHMKDKPTKRSYKLFVLADSSNGYTCNFFVYEGKNTMSTGKGLSYDSVMALLDFSHLGRGYKVFTDSFYTSPTLFSDLLQEHTVACGTMHTNRIGFPNTKENDLSKKAVRGTIRWYRHGHLLFVKWKDTREVYLCSTIHQAYAGDTVIRRVKNKEGVWRTESVPVPAAVKEYNQCMGGVDLSDALVGYYQVLHKTKKWYKTFFFHFMDIAIVNAFVLHKEMAKLRSQRHLSQKVFREMLRLELATLSKTSATRPDRETEAEAGPSKRPNQAAMCMPEFYAADATAVRKRCALCKMAGLLIKTPVYCVKCNVPLCQVPARNCFKAWHDGGHHKKD